MLRPTGPEGNQGCWGRRGTRAKLIPAHFSFHPGSARAALLCQGWGGAHWGLQPIPSMDITAVGSLGRGTAQPCVQMAGSSVHTDPQPHRT